MIAHEFKREVLAELEKARQEVTGAILGDRLRTLDEIRAKIGEAKGLARAADIINATFQKFT